MNLVQYELLLDALYSKCDRDAIVRLQNHDQEQKLIQFLTGLNESYASVRGNILMMTYLPTLNHIYSLLV